MHPTIATTALIELIGFIPDYTVPAMDVDLQEARALFDTNFFAVITMCQTFLPLLMEAKGTVVQIGSVSGVSKTYPLLQEGYRILIRTFLIGIRYFHTFSAQCIMPPKQPSSHSATP